MTFPHVPTTCREAHARIMQQAVRAAGGLGQVVDAIWAHFSDSSVPGRRSSIQLGQRTAMEELGSLGAAGLHTPRGESLRQSIEHAACQLATLVRENEASARQRAASCVMRAMSGEPDSIKTLSVYSPEKVSPTFATALASCL